MNSTDVFYFLLSMLGGFFVIAVPWSGVLLLLARRDPKQPRATQPQP